MPAVAVGQRRFGTKMGREREEWDGIRRDWEGAKPLIYKGFGGFGYPFNALRRRVHYPLCYGE
jgi:hypothetical protein